VEKTNGSIYIGARLYYMCTQDEDEDEVRWEKRRKVGLRIYDDDRIQVLRGWNMQHKEAERPGGLLVPRLRPPRVGIWW
jgi:hypothetical protein